ncbi:hybrid sensor histidine kinase/response regulator [Gemmatimonas phototrophica]|uniref:hybrid sensor histidine kinase/response regulator n=1 Tax=Gemmatimonas phototrophica TaxID=1379270 RepID=UPI0006A70022|nr:MASE1 domain-containing protein [Gemmatimonas phototrophica]
MPAGWVLPSPLHTRRLLGFALATFLAHALSLSFIRFGGPLAPAWPPVGLALAALISLPRSHRPLIIGGYIAIDTVSNLLQGFATPPAIAYLGVSLGEMLLAEALLRRFASLPLRFARLRDVFVLLAATGGATALASIPSAFIARSFSGAPFLESAAVWWVGDVIAFVVITPLTVLVLDRPPSRAPGRTPVGWALETLLMLVVILAASVGSYLERGLVGEVNMGPYMMVVPVLWATLRFGQIGAMLSVLEIAAVGMTMLMADHPLAFGGNTPAGSLIVLQVFLGVLAITSLVLATALREQQETALENARVVEALKTSEQRLRQSQKMEAIGQLAGGVAHDFNNVLAAVMMQLEELRLVREMPRVARELITDVETSVQRAARLTRQLLVFSRQQAMQSQVLDLNTLVRTHAKLLKRVVPTSHTLSVSCHPGPLVVSADSGMVEQVLLNLVLNARDALPQGGSIVIATALREQTSTAPDLPAGRYAVLSVRDNGTGIADEHMPRLFEPFFTTKPPGQGTGLGLATAYGIVQQHKGTLRATSILGRGTTMDVWIPLSNEPLPADLVAGGEALSHDSGEHQLRASVLVVEDEPTVRRLMERVLEREGYVVYSASTGAEALEWCARKGTTLDLVITDLVMPGGMSGTALGRELRQLFPELPVVYTSGYDPEYDPSDVTMLPGENFIPKPASTEQILAVVKRQLALRTR